MWRRLYDTGKLPMRVRMAIYVARPERRQRRGGGASRERQARRAMSIRISSRRRGQGVRRRGDGIPGADGGAAFALSRRDGKPTEYSRRALFRSARFARLVHEARRCRSRRARPCHRRPRRAREPRCFCFCPRGEWDKDNRHQIAHLQLVDPADFPRFKELGVIADMQLEWAKREPATEGPLEPYLGPERYRYLYPAGSLHAAGATISAAATGTSPPTTRFAPFKPPSRELAVRDKSRSTLTSAFRSPRRSTPTPSMPPSP